MPEQSIEEFLHDFRQEIMANAESNMDFLEADFARTVAEELESAGHIEGFEPCHYRKPAGGIRVDGYHFDDIALDLFIVDFSNRESLQSLTATDLTDIFKRAENFFTESAEKGFYTKLEETTPGYDLSRQISDRKAKFSRVNFHLLSERDLSERVKTLEEKKYADWDFSYHVWDISRLHRLRTSRGGREALEIDFETMMGTGLECLPAHLDSSLYQSYLVVMPASILADLYEKYGARLLESNVRSFLQARGNVNKGIRTTILSDPEMFFAYNNGITATARNVDVQAKGHGHVITSIRDLQIVNGGQTTASLFHTRRRDKASLDKIFVQMKLSVVDEEKSEEVVPRISEYANTQNKVNAADFFSNHPFHVRMEEFSRRIWAPAAQGSQRETKWFYERARGQYADAQSKLTPAQQKRFQAEYPKPQMFTKTDLAKYENVWDDKPNYVALGAQKNFARYAPRIGEEWKKNPDHFNEHYYKRAIARAIIFRHTEKLVSGEAWYILQRSYRAQIVAYTIAMISEICQKKKRGFDFIKVWGAQEISLATEQTIRIIAKVVNDHVHNPVQGFSHIGEWCKRDICWDRLKSRVEELLPLLPPRFYEELLDKEDVKEAKRDAAKTQKIDDGIIAQKMVMELDAAKWKDIMVQGQRKRLYGPAELSALQIASQIPLKIPSEKQALVLLDALEKARTEAIYQDQ